MTTREKLAASIIDTVSDAIERQHPELKGIALLHGVEYHQLEKEIIKKILTHEAGNFHHPVR